MTNLVPGPVLRGKVSDLGYSLVISARLNAVDPQAWLADVLARLSDLPQHRLHELLPWEWKALRMQAKAA